MSYEPFLSGISLIEKVTQYKYIEMGPQTYMTLMIPANENNGFGDDEEYPAGQDGCLQGYNNGLC